MTQFESGRVPEAPNPRDGLSPEELRTLDIALAEVKASREPTDTQRFAGVIPDKDGRLLIVVDKDTSSDTDNFFVRTAPLTGETPAVTSQLIGSEISTRTDDYLPCRTTQYWHSSIIGAINNIILRGQTVQARA